MEREGEGEGGGKTKIRNKESKVGKMIQKYI